MTPIDFDTVFLMPTADGMRPTEEEYFGPYTFRLEISASCRDDWKIETVYMIDVEIISQTAEGCRTKEHLRQLEGAWAAQVKEFFYRSDKFGDRIQDKVDHEFVPILPEECAA